MQQRPNRNLVLISGVSGAGKDFLLDRAKDTIPHSRLPRFIHFGGIIRQLARAEQPVGYSEASGGLSGVDPAVMERLKHCAVDLLLNDLASTGDEARVLNYHLTYRQGGSVKVDSDTLIKLLPRDLIMIKSDPEYILTRRIKDSNARKRELESVDAIRCQQDIEEAALREIAINLGARTLLLCNISDDEENISNNVERLAERILT